MVVSGLINPRALAKEIRVRNGEKALLARKLKNKLSAVVIALHI